MLAEYIELGEIQNGIDSGPFPSLAISDTEEVLKRIGKEWKIPEPFGKHVSSTDLFKYYDKEQFRKYCDQIFTGWFNYCDSSLRGYEIVNKSINEHVVSGDRTDVEHYSLFLNILPKEADLPKTIISIRDAFSILLSDELRNKLNLEKPIKKPSKETRAKIDTLVKQMKILNDAHFDSLFARLKETEEGD